MLRYGLPSLFEIFSNPPAKLKWKATLRQHMTSFVANQLKSDAGKRSTLRYLNTNICGVGCLHPSLASVSNSPRDIIRSGAKVRLLLGQYRLQSDIAKQSGGSPTCRCCKQGPEDLFHIFFICPPLRDLFLNFMLRVRDTIHVAETWSYVQQSRENILQLIIDSSKLLPYAELEQIHRIETISRNYFYAVHCRRSTILG